MTRSIVNSMSFFTKVLGLFGVGTNGTNVIKQVTDVVDNYKPGKVTTHNMDIETTKVEDASQDSARKFDAPAMDDTFNGIVNGLNRLPRPLFALWSFGVLVGLFPIPSVLATAPALVLNIIWTVVGFFFGIRTISNDLPNLVKAFKS